MFKDISLTLLPLALIIPINLVVGSLVFLRQFKTRSGQYFGAAVFFVCLWALGDILLLGARDPRIVDIGYYLFIIAPLLLSLFLLFFTFVFQSSRKVPLWILIAGSISTLLISLGAIVKPDLLISEIVIYSSGNNALVVNNEGYIAYAVFFVILFIGAYVQLYSRYRKVVGLQRTQFFYVLMGIFLSSFLATITNLTLPVIGESSLIWFGPIFTISFVATTVIAVVKHKLFNLQLAIARSLGYVLSVITLAAVYGVMAFVIITIALNDDTASMSERAVNAVLAVMLAFLVRPLKGAFDKVTNRVFYRDAYDSQILLDELNKILVSSVDLRPLLSESAEVIRKNLKADYCYFKLNELKSGEAFGYIGSGPLSTKLGALNSLGSEISQLKESIIVADYIEDEYEDFKQDLQAANAAIVGRLVAIAKDTNEVGYMILGSKKSGNLYTKQDLTILDIVLKELAIAVENSLRFEEIQTFNITLQRRIDEATKKLRKSNEKLVALDETKDEFISMASHQLRTPLTSIKGYVSMVLDGDTGEITPQQKQMLNQAFMSSQRMVYLIADLLNVSRMQTGKFVIEPKPTNLAALIDEEISQLKETAKERGLELTYERPKDFPDLMLDETKIRQVIMNFIDNAIYYTHTGGTIAISLHETNSSIECRVTDTGIGVPAHEQHHLFTKFYRAGNAKNARPDGTGLGLFMAKKVVIAQGGAVIFRSTEGKGSTFGFTFSKAKLRVPDSGAQSSPAEQHKELVAK